MREQYMSRYYATSIMREDNNIRIYIAQESKLVDIVENHQPIPEPGSLVSGLRSVPAIGSGAPGVTCSVARSPVL